MLDYLLKFEPEQSLRPEYTLPIIPHFASTSQAKVGLSVYSQKLIRLPASLVQHFFNIMEDTPGWEKYKCTQSLSDPYTFDLSKIKPPPPKTFLMRLTSLWLNIRKDISCLSA